jgi:hypothetical protein
VQRGEQTTVRQWAEVLLENYSKPPLRSHKTHETHQRTVQHLNQAVSDRMLTELSADLIEGYLRNLLRARVRLRREPA